MADDLTATLTAIRERYAARPGDVERLLTALDRVLELHSRWEIRDGDDGEGELEQAVCRHCCAADGGGQTEDCAVTHMADECWPCPTYRAVTAALTGADVPRV
jgi:hypothetical protein